MTRRVVRTAGGLAAAGLALILATACSHHSPATATGRSTASPTGTGATTGAVSGDPGGVSTPGTGAGGGAPGGGPVVSGSPVSRMCAAADLQMAQQPGGDAAGGRVVVAIALTNKSGSDCTVAGYPTFTLAGTSGAASVTVQHDGNGIPAFKTPVPPVNLAPSAKAGFLLAYLNRPTSGDGSCGAATTMSLSVGTGQVSGPVQISLCGSAVNVSPYVTAGQLTT